LRKAEVATIIDDSLALDVERVIALNIVDESLEWQSVVNATVDCDIREALPILDESGVVAYTDGACIKNPGGPAGWSSLLWSSTDFVAGRVRDNATCLECYGHIPPAKTTTNNRAEIAAVLAVLCLAPPALPLTIYSDSEYTIKVAQGTYQMKANPDLWSVYRQLLSFRKRPPAFEWVKGHAGQLHNERADQLAGLGAWNNNQQAYERWQASSMPEARNTPEHRGSTTTTSSTSSPTIAPDELIALRLHVQRVQTFFQTIDPNSGRVSEQERKFVQDMEKRLQKRGFVPSEKQRNWIKGLMAKYKLER
jgi:ribonuclease HI